MANVALQHTFSVNLELQGSKTECLAGRAQALARENLHRRVRFGACEGVAADSTVSACAADVQHPDRGAEQETMRHDEQVELHDLVDPEDLLQAARPACARARVEDSSATRPGTYIETGSDTMVGEAAGAQSPDRDEVSEDNEETVLRKVAVLGSGTEAEEVQDMQAIEKGPTIEQDTAAVGADALDEDHRSSVLDAPEVHQPLTDMLASATAPCIVQAADSCTLPDATDVIPPVESEHASEQAEQVEQVEQAEARLDKGKGKTDDFDFGGCVELSPEVDIGQSKILAADESPAMQRFSPVASCDQQGGDARGCFLGEGAEPCDRGIVEPEAEPTLAVPLTRQCEPDEWPQWAHPKEAAVGPPEFLPHLRRLAGRVFLHYAGGDCTAPGGVGLSGTRFRSFLRDCSILSSGDGVPDTAKTPSSTPVEPQRLDRRTPPGLFMRRSSSLTSLRTVSRKGSKTFLHSSSFTPGFGDSAEAAATEHGKLPLSLCPTPVMTRATADLLYVQASSQREVHMTKDGWFRALASAAQQCMAAGVDEDAPLHPCTSAETLNWFCEWALVPLAEALGISEQDVLSGAEILRQPEVSALLRSGQRGLDIVFARYALAGPAPREPYRKGYWNGQSMQRFAAESDMSAELSHQCLQRIFTGCVQYQTSILRGTQEGKMSTSCFRLALVVIAQRVHSAPSLTPLMRVAMLLLRLSICRGASDLGVAARQVLRAQPSEAL
ncbi:unnamed protein product [Symbiodinium sp. CCMP2592]|nr:unnamed protein product [Symbiodinium sp. CCMP2592]